MSYHISDQLKDFYKDKIWYVLTTSYRELDLCFLELKEHIMEMNVGSSRKMLHQMLGICRVMDFFSIEKKLIQIQQHVYIPDGIKYANSYLSELKIEIDVLRDFIKHNRQYLDVLIIGPPSEKLKDLEQYFSKSSIIRNVMKEEQFGKISTVMNHIQPDLLVIMLPESDEAVEIIISNLKIRNIGTFILQSDLDQNVALPPDLNFNLTEILKIINQFKN